MSRKKRSYQSYGAPFAHCDWREPFPSQHNDRLNYSPYNNTAEYVNPALQFKGNVASIPASNRAADDKSNLHRPTEVLNEDQQNTGSSWTDQYWKKHGSAANIETGKSRKNSKKSYNKVERTLNKMLAKPVEMSKGKSLLEKMGWKGGGLGKDGEGIIEPIAPKATYATHTIGLGLHTETNKTGTKGKRQNNIEFQGKKKKSKMTEETDTISLGLHTESNQTGKRRNKNEWKEEKKRLKIPKRQPKCQEDPHFVLTEEDIKFKMNFRSNVLLRILSFVKDDTQPQLVIKEQLTRLERKKVHGIIDNIRKSETSSHFGFANEAEIKIVGDILAHNPYTLYTESEGEGILRRLIIYKLGSVEMLLITPEDLREKSESNNDVSIVEESKESEKEVEIKGDELSVDFQSLDFEDFESMSDESAAIVEENDEVKCKENAVDGDTNVETMSYKKATVVEEDDGAKSTDNIIAVEKDADSLNYETAATVEENDEAKCKENTIDGDEDAETISYEAATVVEEDDGAKSTDNIIAVDKDADSMNYETAATVAENDEAKCKENPVDSDEDAETMSYEKATIVEDDGAESKEDIEYYEEEKKNKKDVDIESYQSIEADDKDIEVNYETAINDAEINVNDNIDDNNKSNDKKEINDEIKDKIMSKLINLLKTFVNRQTFKELRCLGTFNEDEFNVIELFINICSGHVYDEKYKILEVLKHDSYNFEVRKDINGTSVIYKVKKNLKKSD